MYRRNLHTEGMNYYQRRAYAAARKDQIAAGKQAKVNTLARLQEAVYQIEMAFKPEADKLFAQIVASWKAAYDTVRKYGGNLNDRATTRNKVRTAITGRDFEAEPIPEFKGNKYSNGQGFGEWTSEYKKYVVDQAGPKALESSFIETKEAYLIDYSILRESSLMEHAEKEAAKIVEANKYKLLDSVARYLGEFETVTVTNKDFVKASIKGFQGDFYITTDKGPRLFTCKAITAEGPIVSFHWRFIAHVKEVAKKK